MGVFRGWGLADRIGQWIAAGAPGVERFEHQCFHAHPSDLFGPPLSVSDVALALNVTTRTVQRYAAAAIAGAAQWGWESEETGFDPTGEPITYRAGESGTFTDAEWEPLPLLCGPEGVPLRAEGSAFAVLSARKRGRPEGKGPYQPFQRCRHSGWRWVEVPGYLADEPTDGRLLAGPQWVSLPDA